MELHISEDLLPEMCDSSLTSDVWTQEGKLALTPVTHGQKSCLSRVQPPERPAGNSGAADVQKNHRWVTMRRGQELVLVSA